MATKNFVDKSTVIDAEWLNEADAVVHDVFDAASTKAEARTALNVEDGATADQTGAEIKVAYEANADTNAFTDAEKTLLTEFASSETAVSIAKNLVLPDETGKGIRVGDITTNDWGWRDITSNITVRGVAATDPAWKQIGLTGMYGYDFDVNDFVTMTFHVPHDFVPGSSIHFHAHWFTDGTNAQPVKWEWTFAYAEGFNQMAFPFGSMVPVTAQDNGPGVQYQHMVTETTAQDLSITEPDGLVHVKLTRLTNGGTENTDDIFMLTSDIHYQSTNMSTVGKAPSFYG